MYTEQQPTAVIDKGQLTQKVADLKKDGHRLVVITCTLGENFEITYSFEKDLKYQALRTTVTRADPVVPSISGTYLAAFTYENELQDLFGIKVDGLVLDFKGTFYRTAVKHPFTSIPKPTAAGAKQA